jgi:hypothetical protein
MISSSSFCRCIATVPIRESCDPSLIVLSSAAGVLPVLAVLACSPTSTSSKYVPGASCALRLSCSVLATGIRADADVPPLPRAAFAAYSHARAVPAPAPSAKVGDRKCAGARIGAQRHLQTPTRSPPLSTTVRRPSPTACEVLTLLAAVDAYVLHA